MCADRCTRTRALSARSDERSLRPWPFAIAAGTANSGQGGASAAHTVRLSCDQLCGVVVKPYG